MNTKANKHKVINALNKKVNKKLINRNSKQN